MLFRRAVQVGECWAGDSFGEGEQRTGGRDSEGSCLEQKEQITRTTFVGFCRGPEVEEFVTSEREGRLLEPEVDVCPCPFSSIAQVSVVSVGL